MCGELPGGVTEHEFETYAAERWRPLLRAAWLLTGNWASAEDLVQSTLALVWASWARVRAADRSAGGRLIPTVRTRGSRVGLRSGITTWAAGEW